MDDRLVIDTAGRNALNKIHVSLGKIIATFGEADVEESRLSRTVSVAGEDKSEVTDKTMLTETNIIKEEDESNEGTIMTRDVNSGEGTIVQDRSKDTLVEDLLSDEGV